MKYKQTGLVCQLDIGNGQLGYDLFEHEQFDNPKMRVDKPQPLYMTVPVKKKYFSGERQKESENSAY